ncbi:hypothetical protein N7520_005489 [Penicillium odoratum]|uniref:uncharacterized protein n=1 Tax=Penicillium odoratum TaxID=1167516 RepID=UPI002547E3A4|nr:uncharacterized protein N7520_005489 [Penicillium odoratum]KAJ5765930.1 hypothetical protein N7520_005489 [Penicillium odoratum]
MDPELRVRKRIPKSCRRCHRRKQKCVGSPVCTNCESAHQPCSRSETAPSWHHGMSKGALAHRIESLEAQLAASKVNAPDLARGHDRATGNPDTDTDARSSRPDRSRRHGSGVVRFLTLGTEPNEDAPYLGPSSGLAMAENVNRIVHNTVGIQLLPIHGGSLPSDSRSRRSENARAAPPDDIIGAQILDAYFKNMHVRLPFMDRSAIFDLHAKRHQPPDGTPEAQFGRFQLFMVYAIGAEICQMTETYDSIPSRDFLVTALHFDAALRESISVASIEAMLLMVLYNLRSTSNSSVWYMIGLAMRTCVDFGFHRESRYKRLRPHEAELRRRLFWSVYIIERYTAWSLGRPFSIAEEEIDAEPPSNIDDSLTNDDLLERIINNDLAGQGSQTQHGKLGRFIASIQLQRIVSQIHTRIYRVDKHVSSLLHEVAPLLAALQGFKDSLSSLDLHEGDFVHMHWNNSVRILLQPFIGILNPQDKLLNTCLYASGQMCQFFKKLRQRDSSGYSFLLVNSIFMAGITMCFCLFRSPSLWTPAVSNDLRACYSALFVMAERNTRLKPYRDGLDSIINRAMDFVQEASEAPASLQNNVSSLGVSSYTQSAPRAYPPDAIPHVEPPMPVTQSTATQGSGAELFGFQDSNIFQDLQDLSTSLQDGLSRDNPALTQPFQSIFTEDFWAVDAFNLPMLDEFGWRS